jgi:hypothetical protein
MNMMWKDASMEFQHLPKGTEKKTQSEDVVSRFEPKSFQIRSKIANNPTMKFGEKFVHKVNTYIFFFCFLESFWAFSW